MQQPAINPQRRLAATVSNLLPALRVPGSRGTILEKALRLFAEQGYAGTSIRDIAFACDIKPATLYSHFPSKEHVLAEIVRIGHEEQMRQTRTALMECQPEPAAQAVAYTRAHVRFHAELPMLAVVCNAELHMLSAELGAPAFEYRKQSIQVLTDLVQRGVDHGVFNIPSVWLTAAAIGGMGIRVSYWYSPDSEFSIDELTDAYADMALRILGVTQGQ